MSLFVHPRVLILDRGTGNHYALGLAGGLRGLGWSVAVAGPACDPSPDVVPVFRRAGVPGRKAAKAWEGSVGLVRLVRLVLLLRPDVLHFQWAELEEYAIARALRPVLSARIVFTVHNPIPRGASLWQGRMVRLADALIVHGPRLRDDLLGYYGTDLARVFIVPHGNVNHAVVRYDRVEARRRLGLPLDGPVFSFVGQLQPRKGLVTLIDAFRMHCERGGEGVLVVAGPAYGVDPGLLRERLGPHAERARLMTGPGHLPREQIDLVVSAATQVVLPFDTATQSGSLIFAMTHGRCVVTTSVGEIAETVGDRGLVVPPRDPHALAEALALATRDPGRCDELGRVARAYVLAELDWRRLAELTLAAYGRPVAASTSAEVGSARGGTTGGFS